MSYCSSVCGSVSSIRFHVAVQQPSAIQLSPKIPSAHRRHGERLPYGGFWVLGATLHNHSGTPGQLVDITHGEVDFRPAPPPVDAESAYRTAHRNIQRHGVFKRGFVLAMLRARTFAGPSL